MFSSNLIIVISLIPIVFCEQNLTFDRENFTLNYNFKQYSLLRSGFGSIVWSFTDSNDLNNLQLTPQCIQSLQNIHKSIKLGETWPLNLVDASGRAPVDFTGFGYLDVGNYDKCLGLSWLNNNQTETGQHCLLSVNPVKSSIINLNPFTKKKIINHEEGFSVKIGFCLPSSCSPNDIHTLVQKSLFQYSWEVITIDSCQKKQTFIDKLTGLSTATKISSLIIGIFLPMSIICSLIVLAVPNNRNEWINCFSIQSNLRATFSPKITPNSARLICFFEIFMHIVVLHFHSLVWPMVNHGASIYGSQHPFIKHSKNIWLNCINNDFLFSGIFVLLGIKHAVQIWPKTDKNTPLSYYLLIVTRRLIGTTLVVALIVNLEMITPLLADGPFVPSIALFRAKICSSNWYSNLIYTQNTYAGFPDMCALHTWSIAVEMKLSLVLFALIYIYKTRPNAGFYLNISLIIGGLLYVSQIFYFRKLAPHGIVNGYSSTDFANFKLWMQYIYFSSPNHLSSYLTPVFLIYLISNGFKLDSLRLSNLIKWSVVIVSLLIICFLSPVFWGVIQYDSPLVFALYSGLFRLLSLSFYLFFVMFSVGDKIHHHLSRKVQPQYSDNNDNNVALADNIYLRQDSKSDRLIQTIVIILRSTYFVHVSVFIWYYSSQKWPIVSLSDLIGHLAYAMILAIVTGLIFQLIVLGPFLSLIVNKVGTSLRPEAKVSKSDALPMK